MRRSPSHGKLCRQSILGPTVAEVLQALGETTPDDALPRRVEEASLNAWPALQQMLLDGWVLRFSKGFTRRANSVTPVYPSTQPIPDKVRYCENLYARDGLPTYFRLTTLRDADGLDEVLAERGYVQQERARVLHRTLATGTLAPGPGFALAPLGSFLATYTELTGLRGHLENSGLDGQAAAALHGSVLRAIRGETVFGLLVDGGQPVACGMAVVEGELAGLFDIVTHPDRRRRGYGRILVQSLLAHAPRWAQATPTSKCWRTTPPPWRSTTASASVRCTSTGTGFPGSPSALDVVSEARERSAKA